MTAREPLTPEVVERRFFELQQLSRLGASLAQAELPPMDRRILERRSVRVVGRAPGAGPDPRDVRLHVEPTAFDRQLGWMPDAWVDPASGLVAGAGLTLLAGACVDHRAVDAIPRGRRAIIVLRFLSARPACVDALPVLDQSDQCPRWWLCLACDRARTRW